MASFKEIVTDALRYWEPRRLVYNGVLAALVAGVFALTLPESLEMMDAENVLVLVALAVIANLLYCAAYVPDVFVQMSDFRDAWRRWRWVLFAGGTLLAAALTVGMACAVFGAWFWFRDGL